MIPPFAPAEGVLTLRRSGLVREQRFTIAAASETLAIPIEDGFTPNVQVQVDLVGAAPREAAAGSTPNARAARLRQRPSQPGRASPLALARARGHPARAGARPGRRDRARPVAQGRDGRPGRERRGRGGRRRRGRARADGLSPARPPRRLLLVAHAGCRRLPAAVPCAARHSRHPGPPAGRAGGRSGADVAFSAQAPAAGFGADAEDGRAGEGRGRAGRRPDPRAHGLQRDGAVRGERAARCGGPGERAREAARQPDPLSRDGGGRLRRATLRLGRGDAHRAAAADGAAVPAALPELRRPLRAARRGAEPDRPRR